MAHVIINNKTKAAKANANLYNSNNASNNTSNNTNNNNTNNNNTKQMIEQINNTRDRAIDFKYICIKKIHIH